MFSFVLTVQFLQHMLHLVMGATGTICWFLQLEGESSECEADADSDEGDDGATGLVAAGSSHWKMLLFSWVLYSSVFQRYTSVPWENLSCAVNNYELV